MITHVLTYSLIDVAGEIQSPLIGGIIVHLCCRVNPLLTRSTILLPLICSSFCLLYERAETELDTGTSV